MFTFKYQLVFLAINKLLVAGEWIEMPQFSDDSKVYKLSVKDHTDSFYNKFADNNQKTVTDYNVKTIEQLLNQYGTTTDKNTSKGTENSMNFFETDTISPSNISQDSLDDFITANDDLEEILPIDEEVSTTTVPSTLEVPTEGPSIFSTSIPITKSESSFSNEEETVKEVRFEDYLPMEMLRKVHQTLKAQPSSLEGKIRFLKQFENDLVAEIEARLSTALAPPRRTRGAHDYWDHDEELGFPSLEGALMAISFLTFAVYLIRLVMLLFRNANNTTTTGATIFFGRNRRSTDILNNKTEEILNYINTFDKN